MQRHIDRKTFDRNAPFGMRRPVSRSTIPTAHCSLLAEHILVTTEHQVPDGGCIPSSR
jgi:hypothetical protein